MKTILYGCLILLSSWAIQGQEGAEFHLLKTDSTWGKEIFKLPTGFAQEMTVSGFEDASFPPGWSDVESPEFWTYIFAWSVDSEKMLSVEKLENNLKIYFDGLNDIKPETVTATRLPSTVLLIQSIETNVKSTFIGKVRIFDRFKTNEMLTLHLLIDQRLCTEQKKTIISFKFSPRPFTDAIWEKLKSVPLLEDVCFR